MLDVDVLWVKVFTDNYVWIIVNKENNAGVIVDPGDAKPVLDFLAKNNITPEAILVTHHHNDHSGGVKGITQEFDIPVYAKVGSSVAGVTDFVDDGDSFSIKPAGMDFRVLAIPGHTLDHIAFILNDALFCGDTLFSGGCGRVFEGTYEQMYASLSKLRQLDINIRVYCGHEYTLSNMLFAYDIEKDNADVKNCLDKARQLTQENINTLPSTIAIEKKINPFLRCDDKDFVAHLAQSHHQKFDNPVAVFQYVRELKNSFKAS